MAMPSKIVKATISLNLTHADGTAREETFTLDVTESDPTPITMRFDWELDVVDLTDVTVDTYRRRGPGDRRRYALEIGGRGPAAGYTNGEHCDHWSHLVMAGIAIAGPGTLTGDAVSRIQRHRITCPIRSQR